MGAVECKGGKAILAIQLAMHIKSILNEKAAPHCTDDE